MVGARFRNPQRDWEEYLLQDGEKRMTHYFEHEALNGIYLEDSYVLGISASRGLLTIEGEFVLTEEHPYFTADHPGESYCYRRGIMVFEGVTSLIWTEQLEAAPSKDPDGSIDYGNIDSLTVEGNNYLLEGDLGKIDLHAGSVRMVVAPEKIVRSYGSRSLD